MIIIQDVSVRGPSAAETVKILNRTGFKQDMLTNNV